MKGSLAASEGQSVREALDAVAVDLHFGRSDSALARLKEVETTEPNNPWASYYVGVAKVQQGKFREAVQSLERAEGILHRFGDPDADLAQRIREVLTCANRELL